jgi:L-cysteine S-thiosulfotransferase
MLAGLVIAAGLVVGDGMPEPLTTTPGDAQRGRAIVVNRQKGLCLLCHSGPFPEEKTPGNVSTDLSGAGQRWSTAQLRLRVVDARRLDPTSLMPSFHQASSAARVAPPYAGQPILNAQEVEDVVAFLGTLK